MKNLCAAAAVLLLLVTTSCTSKTDPALTYPVAKKVEVVDEYFGIKVPDPYRWIQRTAAAGRCRTRPARAVRPGSYRIA